jgi:peptidyl-tRNA hydrolase
MYVDSNVKQVAIILQGEPMSKQELFKECGTGFTIAFEQSRKTHPTIARKWMENGYMKIVLKCPTQEKFDEIYSKVITNNFPNTINDRILVVGPIESDKIDSITGELKLL